MIFTPGKDTLIPPTLQLDGNEIEIVTSYIYLGVEITNNLDWSIQWERIQKNISSIPYLIKQLRRLGFSQNILITVYKSLVISHFDYSSPILSTTTKYIKSQINQTQKKILRIIGFNEKKVIPPRHFEFFL